MSDRTRITDGIIKSACAALDIARMEHAKALNSAQLQLDALKAQDNPPLAVGVERVGFCPMQDGVGALRERVSGSLEAGKTYDIVTFYYPHTEDGA